MKEYLAVLCFTLSAMPSWAATQTVTLSVPGMNCATCPITVKKALSKVAGVNEVKVNYEKREARVSFDDAKTNVQSLTLATKEAGYPSSAPGAAK
jgi:periplasmic mercuric ion binding protein